MGDQIAVLLDSRVWALAPIASPTGGAGSVTIATNATGEDAARIALQVRPFQMASSMTLSLGAVA